MPRTINVNNPFLYRVDMSKMTEREMAIEFRKRERYVAYTKITLAAIKRVLGE